jgi:hypothetical protein
MKKILLAVALLALHADFASATGKPRYLLEGEIKVRFYYDVGFYGNGFFNYNNLEGDLLNALTYTGTYGLGLKFVKDTSSYNFLVDLGSRQTWSRVQEKTWMDANMPLQTGLVKVLIHSRGMTPDGVCYDDIPGSGLSSYDQGITYRALPAGGKATGQIMVTAKSGCSVNTAGLVSQTELKTTFVHEVGHALGHPGDDNRMSQCTTPPQASVMCHSVKNGAKRVWQKWFAPDVTSIRTDVFDTANRRFPLPTCYEYSTRQICTDECANTAGFPNQGATEIYNSCVAQYCDNMCR